MIEGKGPLERLARFVARAASRVLVPLPDRPLARVDDKKALLLQVKAENGFLESLATYLCGCVFFIGINAISSGLSTPWSIFPIAGWGLGVVLSGSKVLFARRIELLDTLRERGREVAPAPTLAEDPTRLAALRTRLLESAEAARSALRREGPDGVAAVARGETQALALVAWLSDAESEIRESARDRDLRRDVAARISEPSARQARDSLARLLKELDARDQRLVSLEKLVDDRRARLESFLLALESARRAPAGQLVSAVSAPLAERVALLEESASAPGPAEAAATPSDRFSEEVRLARELQRSILPSEAPLVAGLDVAHAYRPSSEVGGDFYDFYRLSEGRLLVALGDASGHGLDSSMVASMCKSALYMQVSARRPLPEILSEMNRMMCDTLGRRRLMTLTLLEIDTGARRVTWVNAGHVFPIRSRGGAIDELAEPGYPLGVRRDGAYRIREEPLHSGDLLLLVTDGVVEAQDACGDPFGWERLDSCLSRSSESAAEVLSGVLSDLEQHLGELPPQDDVTVLAVRYAS